MADVLLDGARVVRDIVAVAGAPLESVTDEGETMHEDSPTREPLKQLSATVLVFFEAGVIVSVAVPGWPAVKTTGVEGPAIVKSGTFTVTNTVWFDGL